jgi:hypothetical protein
MFTCRDRARTLKVVVFFGLTDRTILFNAPVDGVRISLHTAEKMPIALHTPPYILL